MRPLNLERFAQLSAEMLVGSEHTKVLQGAGVDDATWEASRSFWLGRMTEDAQRGRTELATRFGRLVAAHRRSLEPKPSQDSLDHRLRAVDSVAIALPEGRTKVADSGQMRAATATYAARLTLEQFAAMRAETVSLDETEHAAMRTRFGLDEATFALEENAWQERLARDPEVFQKYVARFQYYRGLFRPRG